MKGLDPVDKLLILCFPLSFSRNFVTWFLANKILDNIPVTFWGEVEFLIHIVIWENRSYCQGDDILQEYLRYRNGV